MLDGLLDRWQDRAFQNALDVLLFGTIDKGPLDKGAEARFRAQILSILAARASAEYVLGDFLLPKNGQNNKLPSGV